MEKQIESFLEFIQNDKKLSDNTLQSYRRDILQYEKYVEENNINYAKVKQEDIKDYLNYYIYDNGDVLNINTNKILSGSVGENGYKYFRLSQGGKKKMFYCHRLVAEAFIPNSKNLPVVNHKDGNKLNNNVENLEWVTYNENTEHFHKEIKKNTLNRKTEYYKEDLPNE